MYFPTHSFRNLAVTLRSLSLVSGVVPDIRSHLLSGPLISDRQETTLARLENEGLRAINQLIKYYLGIWTTPRGITATIWERLSGRSFRLLTLHCNNNLQGVQCAWNSDYIESSSYNLARKIMVTSISRFVKPIQDICVIEYGLMNG